MLPYAWLQDDTHRLVVVRQTSLIWLLILIGHDYLGGVYMWLSVGLKTNTIILKKRFGYMLKI